MFFAALSMEPEKGLSYLYFKFREDKNFGVTIFQKNIENIENFRLYTDTLGETHFNSICKVHTLSYPPNHTAISMEHEHMLKYINKPYILFLM